LINEESRKAGKQHPSAPPALRAGQWEKERIVVREEDASGFSFSAFPAFLLSSFINPPPSAPSDFLD
jgi:hypothetical protein